MVKSKYFILLFVSMLFCVPIVHGACSYEKQVQLAREGANVKFLSEAGWYGTGDFEKSEVPNENGEYESYEITEPKVILTIYNITENVYVEITNLSDQSQEIYYYDDTEDGKVSWEIRDLDEIKKYEMKVYSNDQDCLGDELNKTTLTVPKINPYSYKPYCTGVNEYYCQEFITQEITMSEEEVKKAGYEKQAQNGNNPEPSEIKEEDFWKKYGIYFIVGGVLIVGVATAVMIIRKQRRNVL